VSKRNGEKARSAVTARRRAAQRVKARALKEQFLEEHGQNKKSVIETVKASKPVVKATEAVKRAGDALAELAEMAKPKRKNMQENASMEGGLIARPPVYLHLQQRRFRQFIRCWGRAISPPSTRTPFRITHSAFRITPQRFISSRARLPWHPLRNDYLKQFKEGNMIDTRNPNEQFHSYQAPDFTPTGSTTTRDSDLGSSVNARGGLAGMLEKIGLNPSSMSSMKDSLNKVQVGDTVTKARTYAAANPGKVLGGLAALVIGAGMMRGRSMR
jgi:hypothetical protein